MSIPPNVVLDLNPDELARFERLIDQLAQASPAEKEKLLASLDDELAARLLGFAGVWSPGISTLPAGFVLGDCVLVELVGAGGFGAVYKANQSCGDIHRPVAVKIVRPEFLRPEVLARFETEMALLADLSRERNAGLAQVFRAGRGGIPGGGPEVPYLVMEYVDGRPLDAFARRSSGLLDQVRLMARVCATVQTVHAAGIIHADLKPDNVLVTHAGQPVLLDFGMAQKRRSYLPINAIGGSAPYMAPEHFGAQFTEKADVYSLGVLSFEVLTNHLPYAISRGDASEYEHAICAGNVRRLREIQADLPAGLEAIVAKALSLLPKDRFASAGAMGVSLENWLASTEAPQASPTSVDQEITIVGKGNVTGIRSKPKADLFSGLSIRQKIRVNRGGSVDITGYDGS